jgi:hypothetical protein
VGSNPTLSARELVLSVTGLALARFGATDEELPHFGSPDELRVFVADLVLAVGVLRCLLTPGEVGIIEIVAAIAETQPTHTVRKRLKDLLLQGTTLADASTWPEG